MFDRLHMPALDGATAWLISAPLSPAELRGHVVVVNFWTLTCINWLRTEPYVRGWWQAYRNDRLVVIGVHTPEFSFEHDIERVRRATRVREIDYPVAVDNQYEIWSAFANHCGRRCISSTRMAASATTTSAKVATPSRSASYKNCSASSAIRFRWRGSGWRPRLIGSTCGRPRPIWATAAATASRHRPERRPGYGWPTTSPNAWVSTSGPCPVSGRSGRRVPCSIRTPGVSRSGSTQGDAHLVVSPGTREPISFRVLLDGEPPGRSHGVDVDEEGNGLLQDGRMYQLVRTHDAVRDRTLEITFLGPGAEAYVFTFG